MDVPSLTPARISLTRAAYGPAQLTTAPHEMCKAGSSAVETLTPLANKLGLQIDTRAGRDDIDDLIDHIKKLDANATAIVCWEHKVIRDIAKALGVDHAPDYYSDDFDHEWRIREGELDEAHEHC